MMRCLKNKQQAPEGANPLRKLIT